MNLIKRILLKNTNSMFARIIITKLMILEIKNLQKLNNVVNTIKMKIKITPNINMICQILLKQIKIKTSKSKKILCIQMVEVITKVNSLVILYIAMAVMKCQQIAITKSSILPRTKCQHFQRRMLC